MGDKPLYVPWEARFLTYAAWVVVGAGAFFYLFVPLFTTWLGRTHCGSSSCESNMKQIGNAIKMYLSDWNDTFPTNRPFLNGHKVGPIRVYVKLSPHEPIGNATEPPRFSYGVNWVEGLYSYIENVTKASDPQSVWRCQAASSRVYPEGSKTAAVNYVFNRNLVERSARSLTYAANLMVVREIDAVVNAELRPTNDTTWTSKTPPRSPFLTSHDTRAGHMNPKIHGAGSHILFADGHVKVFDASFFPERITKSRCWDPDTKQWYNYAPGSGKPEGYTKSIAITP